MTAKRTGKPDAQGFSEYTLTCAECGATWTTTVSGDGGVPAVRLLSRIFAGWDVVPNGPYEMEADLCPKHFEVRA
jgi:hypothetical protein